MEIFSENDRVVLNVDDGKGYVWQFKCICAEQATAQIIAEYFKNLLFKREEGLKKKFYLAGYADGKSKRKNLWK